MQIKWTKLALRHLGHALRYWQQEQPAVLPRLMTEIQTGLKTLKKYPSSGRPGRIFGTKEFLLQRHPYILAYRVLREELQILAFLHTSRKWPNHF